MAAFSLLCIYILVHLTNTLSWNLGYFWYCDIYFVRLYMWYLGLTPISGIAEFKALHIKSFSIYCLTNLQKSCSSLHCHQQSLYPHTLSPTWHFHLCQSNRGKRSSHLTGIPLIVTESKVFSNAYYYLHFFFELPLHVLCSSIYQVGYHSHNLFAKLFIH